MPEGLITVKYNFPHPPLAEPVVIQVPKRVAPRFSLRDGMRTQVLHEERMAYKGRRGLIRTALAEIHATQDRVQGPHRDVYVISRGRGFVHLNGRRHAIEEGKVVVIAPGTRFRFESKGQPLLALLNSNPHVFPVINDRPGVVSVEGKEFEESACGLKNFAHNVEQPGCNVPTAHTAILDIASAPLHGHLFTHEIYYFLKGRGKMNINGVDHAVRPGTLIILPPGVLHAARSDNPKKGVIALMTFHPGLHRLMPGVSSELRDEYRVDPSKPPNAIERT